MVLLIAANEQLGASQCGCFCSQEADSKGGELQVCEKSGSSIQGSPCVLGVTDPHSCFHTCPFQPRPGLWNLDFEQVSQRQSFESDALLCFPGSETGTMIPRLLKIWVGESSLIHFFLPTYVLSSTRHEHYEGLEDAGASGHFVAWAQTPQVNPDPYTVLMECR